MLKVNGACAVGERQAAARHYSHGAAQRGAVAAHPSRVRLGAVDQALGQDHLEFVEDLVGWIGWVGGGGLVHGLLAKCEERAVKWGEVPTLRTLTQWICWR